jgi:hypothetical protein
VSERLGPTDCAFFNCHERALFRVETRGTVRLAEEWVSCQTHMTRLTMWLLNRDKQWDLPTDKATIIELDISRARG